MSCANDNLSTMTCFTPFTRQVLSQAGWYAERQVSIDGDLRSLQEYGYTVHEKAQTFLASFSGIVLDYRLATQYGNLRCVTHFIIAESLLYADELNIYNEAIGEPFCIVGETGNQHITLVMGTSGKVYGCNDGVVHHFGQNGAEAIDQIVRSDVERFRTI